MPKITTIKYLAALLGATALLACVTINVYFPEAAVKDLSEKIEDAVAREAEAAGEPAATDSTTSEGEQTAWLRPWTSRLVAAALYVTAPRAWAQEEDVAAPEISNPAIRKIIASRGKRVAELAKFKASGVIGENNKALLEIRNLSALPLRERASLQKLAKAENEDRLQMFKEIAAATGADLGQVPQIQTTYAATLRAKAKAGEWIQMADGTWKKK